MEPNPFLLADMLYRNNFDYIDAPDAILKQRLSQRSGIIAACNLQNFENLRQQFEAPDVAQGETYIHIRNG